VNSHISVSRDVWCGPDFTALPRFLPVAAFRISLPSYHVLYIPEIQMLPLSMSNRRS